MGDWDIVKQAPGTPSPNAAPMDGPFGALPASDRVENRDPWRVMKQEPSSSYGTQAVAGAGEGFIEGTAGLLPATPVIGAINTASQALGSDFRLPTPANVVKSGLGTVGLNPNDYPAQNLQQSAVRNTAGALANPLSYVGGAGAIPKVVGAGLSGLGSTLGDVEGIKGTGWETPARIVGGLLGMTPGLAGKQPVPTLDQSSRMHGVRLSEGERTGDLTKLQTEQKARTGQLGQEAQQHVKQFDDARQGDLDRLDNRVTRGMDDSMPRAKDKQILADTPQEAGEMIGEQLGKTAKMRKDVVSDYYKDAATYPGEIHPIVFRLMGQRIKNELFKDPDNPIVVDPKLTPYAAMALRDIDQNVSRLTNTNRANPYGQPGPQQVSGVTLGGVDFMRRRLAAWRDQAFNSGNRADGAAAQAVLKAFMGKIDEAMTGPNKSVLYKGDPGAGAAWERARAQHAQYRADFGGKSEDAVGAKMEKILGNARNDPATGIEVMNQIISPTGKVNTTNVGLVRRLRENLGEDSPEWAAVRQGVWKRLTQKPEGVPDWGSRQLSNRISTFLEEGKEMAQELFTKKQLAAMTRFRNVHNRIASVPGGVNTSMTAPFIAESVDRATKAAAAGTGAIIGHAVAPGLGAAGEIVGAVAGAKSVGWMKNRRTMRDLRRQMPLQKAPQPGQWRQNIAGDPWWLRAARTTVPTMNANPYAP